MAEYISREAVLQKFLERGSGYINVLTMRDMINEIPAADVKPVKKTEFQIGYEQGFNDGRASAALPNIIDNGDKIDGYTYMYKTDSRGEPYIHIDSVRSMLKKAADVQLVRHGRWTYPYKDKDINQCSECRSCVQDKISNVREMFAYCPFCGARMDGDTDA